jgi:hypothetical protein
MRKGKMGTFLEEVKGYNPKSQHLLDRIMSQMTKEDATELREALTDENVKLVAIRKALANRGFNISQAHLSTYRSEVRNGVR